MARQKSETNINTELPATPGLPAMVEAADTFAVIEANYSSGRDFINQVIGRQEIVNAFESFSRTIGISELAKIKETKQYRDVKGMKIPHSGKTLSGTWEEFCNLLGKSVDQVDRDITNLKTFGEEALESMQRIGIGYRELRQYRQLPQTQQEELIEAAKANDKDAFLEVAEELITKHVKEKTELTKKLQEQAEDKEANERVMANKSAKIDDLEKQIHKLQNKAGDWHPRAFEIAMEITRAGGIAIAKIDSMNTLRDVILNEDFGEQDSEAAIEHMALVYSDMVNQLVDSAAALSMACDAVFIGYKEKARPILEVFGKQDNQG